MTKINILALGGLDEKTKNMLTIEIDSKIFIVDAGIYEPLTNHFGIQHFIPNLSYLEAHRDKIKGIFLSNYDRQQIGALSQLLKFAPNIPIYASETTISMLPIIFKNANMNKWNTVPFTNKEVKSISGVNVQAFTLTSALPGTLGYSFNTKEGNIVYFMDYIFDVILEYQTELIDSLQFLSSHKNLLFISDSLNLELMSSIAPKFRIKNTLESLKAKKKPIIASIYEDEITNVVELINFIHSTKRRLVVLDEDMKAMLENLIKLNHIAPLKFTKVEETEKDSSNVVYLITGTRTNLYSRINVFIEEGFSENRKITPDDLFASFSPPQPGNEHQYQDITNKIAKIDPEFIGVSENAKKSIHPSQFDLKNYLMFIKPKYFMPLKGFFKEFLKAKEVAQSIGIEKENIIIEENGTRISFENGKIVSKEELTKGKGKSQFGSKVIEAANDLGLESEIINERESLGKNGLLSTTILLDKTTNKLRAQIDVQVKGVIYLRSQKDLVDKLTKISMEAISERSPKTNDSQTIAIINKAYTKYLRQTVKKTPLLITNIINSDSIIN